MNDNTVPTVAPRVSTIAQSIIADQKTMIQTLKSCAKQGQIAEEHMLDSAHSLLICVAVAIFAGFCLFFHQYIAGVIIALYAVACYRDCKRSEVKLKAAQAVRNAAWERYLDLEPPSYCG